MGMRLPCYGHETATHSSQQLFTKNHLMCQQDTTQLLAIDHSKQGRLVGQQRLQQSRSWQARRLSTRWVAHSQHHTRASKALESWSITNSKILGRLANTHLITSIAFSGSLGGQARKNVGLSNNKI